MLVGCGGVVCGWWVGVLSEFGADKVFFEVLLSLISHNWLVWPYL